MKNMVIKFKVWNPNIKVRQVFTLDKSCIKKEVNGNLFRLSIPSRGAKIPAEKENKSCLPAAGPC